MRRTRGCSGIAAVVGALMLQGFCNNHLEFLSPKITFCLGGSSPSPSGSRCGELFQATVTHYGKRPIVYEIGNPSDPDLHRQQVTDTLLLKVTEVERRLQHYGPQATHTYQTIDLNCNFVLSHDEAASFDVDAYVHRVQRGRYSGNPQREPLYVRLRR